MKTLFLVTTFTLLLLAPALSAQLSFTADATLPAGIDPEGLAAGDLDGDGDLDLVVANSDSNFLSFYFTSGGSLTTGPSVAIPGQAADIVLFDLDGDGDLDLATANGNTNTMTVLINNGSGSFAISSTLPAGTKPRKIIAADFDGDGDMDVALCNRDSNNVSLYTNTAGVLAASGSFSVGTDPRWISAGDLDGDGDNDLAVVNHDSNTITVHTNNGAGSFTTGASLSLLRPNAVEIGDLDSDGDLDLAVTQGNATPPMNGLVVYRNDGGLVFTHTGLFATGLDPQGVDLFDADGDGDLDAATADTDSNQVSVLENLGAGSFAAAISFAAGLRPQDVASIDYNGDGAIDLVATNADSNNISTGRNDGVPSFVPYGVGCGSAGSVPTLSGSGVASPGNSIAVTMTGLPNANILLLFGTQPASTPIANGCTLLVGGIALSVPLQLDAGGSLVLPATLSPSTPLGSLFLQFFHEDAGAPNGRFGLSNGLEIRVH